jgi:hypothetical protein
LRITSQDLAGLGLRAGDQSLCAAARRALGSSFFKFVKIDSSTTSTPNATSAVQTSNQVSVSESKKPNAAIKNIAVVQCEGFRCLAYRDEEKWRDFQTGKELPEVKSIVYTFSV